MRRPARCPASRQAPICIPRQGPRTSVKPPSFALAVASTRRLPGPPLGQLLVRTQIWRSGEVAKTRDGKGVFYFASGRMINLLTIIEFRSHITCLNLSSPSNRTLAPARISADMPRLL